MGVKATAYAFRQRGLSPAARLVLIHVADCHDDDAGVAFASLQWIREVVDLGEADLAAALSELAAARAMVASAPGEWLLGCDLEGAT